MNPTSIALMVAQERDRSQRDLDHRVALAAVGAQAPRRLPNPVAALAARVRSIVAATTPEPACETCPVPA